MTHVHISGCLPYLPYPDGTYQQLTVDNCRTENPVTLPSQQITLSEIPRFEDTREMETQRVLVRDLPLHHKMCTETNHVFHTNICRRKHSMYSRKFRQKPQSHTRNHPVPSW